MTQLWGFEIPGQVDLHLRRAGLVAGPGSRKQDWSGLAMSPCCSQFSAPGEDAASQTGAPGRPGAHIYLVLYA